MAPQRSILLFFLMWPALAATGCSSGGNDTVRCVYDTDCPPGQQCVGGNCQIPADEGPRPCSGPLDCPPGQQCEAGLCVPVPEEPDAGFEPDADDSADGGEGGEEPADLPPDEDKRDFSGFAFTLAVAEGPRGSGPAAQCIAGLRPEPDSGPVLPVATAVAGVRLSGLVRDGSIPLPGATVRAITESAECAPAPTTTDSAGAFELQLVPGRVLVEITTPDSRVYYHQLDVSSPTTQTFQLAQTDPLSGGPLQAPSSQGGGELDGWTLAAAYQTGAGAGRMAHLGVTTGRPLFGPGEFTIDLPVGFTYELIAIPPPGQSYPRQIVYEGQTIDPLGQDLLNDAVRLGFNLMGSITVGGSGAVGASLQIQRTDKPFIREEVTAATGGIYQLILRAGKRWRMEVTPDASAFSAGAMRYLDPDKFLRGDQDTTFDIDLGQGQQVVFTGSLVDSAGNPLGGALVRLLPQVDESSEGLYPYCDPQPVTTAPDGSFGITCNLPQP